MPEPVVFAYLIPGGKQDSQQAYLQLAALCRANNMLFTVYRGVNPHTGEWSLVLIGSQSTFEQYREQIQAPLTAARAQVLTVPPERLCPFVQRFLVTQAEMLIYNTPFLERHHPIPSNRKRGKKSSRKRKRR
jgi:hypothetical protein